LFVFFSGCTEDGVGTAIKPLKAEKDLTPKKPACVPATEVCDGVDNDCDNLVDEENVCEILIEPQEEVTIRNVYGQSEQKEKIQIASVDGKAFLKKNLPESVSELEEPKIFGYIIELQDNPVSVFVVEKNKEILQKEAQVEELKKELESYKSKEDNPIIFFSAADLEIAENELAKMKAVLEEDIENYRTAVIQKHENVKIKINQILPKAKIANEYKEIFNGIVLNVSEKEALELESLPEVKKVYPNYEVKAFLMDSVPLINADDVWLMQDYKGNYVTGEGITIAVIDTGVDYTHSDLGGCFGLGCKVAGGYDFVNDDSDPMDDHGHGTHCASTAAGNGILKGVAPDATVYAYKVLNSRGSGWPADIIAAIERAVDPNQDGDYSDHLDVISMSLGGPGNSNDPTSMAVDTAVDLGVVAVISAGNSGPWSNTIGSPGTARKAITVAASDKSDLIAGFSSRGPVEWSDMTIIKPDITAPGVDICAAQWDSAWEANKCFDDKHTAISGTSMAAPHVAGAAALLKQLHRDITPSEVKFILQEKAVDIGENVYAQGAGRIDILESASMDFVSTLNVDLDYIGHAKEEIKINGTASGTDFSNYTLEVGEGFNPTEWTLVAESNSPVVDNVLNPVYFNTLTLRDGINSLKLTVEDTQGNSKYFKHRFIVDNYTIEIVSPKDSDELKDVETVNITGTVSGPNIEEYIVEYGLGSNPTEWTEISRSSDTVTEGLLAVWNVTELFDDTYTLRVKIKNIYYDSAEEESISVTLNNIYIDFPPQRSIFRAGDTIQIIGNIKMPGFTGYDVYYYPMKSVVNSRQGITLTNNGTTQISNGIIAEWDTSSITEAEMYMLMLEVSGSDKKIYEEVLLFFDPTLKEGWPKKFNWLEFECPWEENDVCNFWGGNVIPVIDDIDNDESKEIMFLIRPDKFYAFGADGNPLNGFPITIPVIVDGEIINEPDFDIPLDVFELGMNDNIPVVGDLDGDGFKEIIFQGFIFGFDFDSIYSIHIIYAYDYQGNLVSGWPVLIDGGFANSNSPVIQDLDKDGLSEVIVKGGQETYVFDSSGNELLRIETPENWGTVGGFETTPAVGNLDQDPELEIISVGTVGEGPGTIDQATLYAFNLDGSFVTGWPKTMPGLIFGSPAIADLDNDGENEVIMPVMRGWENSEKGLYVLDNTGNVVSGWPKLTDYAVWSSPAIGNLDDDQELEIVAEDLSGNVFVFDFEGTIKQGWPKYSMAGISSPSIADIDNDGRADVLSRGAYGIYAWNSDGSLIDGYVKMINQGVATPTLGDIDNDGELEMVSSETWGNGFSTVYVWEVNSPDNQPTMHWPQFHHDAQHTGLYPSQNTLQCFSGQLIGDVDGDGEVNETDLNILIEIVYKNSIPVPENVCCSDLSKDGIVNSIDVVMLSQILNGLAESPGKCPLCSNGTPSGECSGLNYCNNGEFENWCWKCGCPTGQTCKKIGATKTCVADGDGGIPDIT